MSHTAPPRFDPLNSLQPLVPPTTPPDEASTGAAPGSPARGLLAAAVLAALGLGALGHQLLAHRAADLACAPRTTEMRVAAGSPGFRTTSSGARERWGAGPLRVVLDPSLDAIDVGAADAIEAAFGSWLAEGDALPDVTFDRATEAGTATQDGVNRVVLAPITIPGHEDDVAVTVSYADTATGRVVEADVIFNARYVFGDAKGEDGSDVGDEKHPPRCASRRYDAQAIATHEAGHFFGLGEDMEDTKATMYVRSAPCETHKRSLTHEDVAAVVALYAEAPPVGAPDPNAPRVARAGCGVSPLPGSGASGAWAWPLGAAFLVAGRRRRRAPRRPARG